MTICIIFRRSCKTSLMPNMFLDTLLIYKYHIRCKAFQPVCRCISVATRHLFQFIITVIIFFIMCVLCVSELPENKYIITSGVDDCNSTQSCDEPLSWQVENGLSSALLNSDTPIIWRLVPAPGSNMYSLFNQWGCASGEWCDKRLTWYAPDGDINPVVTLNGTRGSTWEITMRQAGDRGWRIRNKEDCPYGQWCNAELGVIRNTESGHLELGLTHREPGINWNFAVSKG